MDKFTSKVLSFIKENGMLSPGDKVVVGFSGGADSTALLNVLFELRAVLKIEVAAIHLNHGMRQEAGEDDDQEKCPADQREGFDEGFSAARIFPDIDAVIDYGSQ